MGSEWLTETTSQCSSTFTSQDVLEYGLRDMSASNNNYLSRCSKKVKRCKTMGLLALILVPVVILAAVCVFFLSKTIVENMELEKMKSALAFSLAVGRLIYGVQVERELCTYYSNDFLTTRFLQDYFKASDTYLDDMPPYLPFDSDQNPEVNTLSKLQIKEGLSNVRLRFWSQQNRTFIRQGYSDVIMPLLDLQLHTMLKVTYDNLWRLLTASHKLIYMSENIGLQLALWGHYTGTGGLLSTDDFLLYTTAIYETRSMWSTALRYIPKSRNYNKLVHTINYTIRMEPSIIYKTIFSNLSAQVPVTTEDLYYFGNMTEMLTQLFYLREEISSDLEARIAGFQKLISDKLYSSTILLIIHMVSTPLIIRVVYGLITRLHQCVLSLADATKGLKKEKRRTDTLLYQMLPIAVAESLKKGKTEAEYFSSCSIIFSAVDGFSGYIEKMSPMEIVAVLSDLFKKYDQVIGKDDLYKVESISDCYMVCSGLPRRNGLRHAYIIAMFALQIQETTASLYFPELPSPGTIALRIGINTGSCMAGVVGQRRPRFCLFGDTVNTASRMESTCLRGRIQITSTTQKLLKKYRKGCFNIAERGIVDIKGKGQMKTYWLMQNLDQPNSASNDISMHSSDFSHSTSMPSTSFCKDILGAQPERSFGKKPYIPTINEVDSSVRSSFSFDTSPIPQCKPAFASSLVLNPVSPSPSSCHELEGRLSPSSCSSIEKAYRALKASYEEKSGSPPILQLTEGLHF